MNKLNIEPIQPPDLDEWLRMRQALWTSSTRQELADEIRDFFSAKKINGLLSEVFVLRREPGGLGGFVEVSLRPLARGCVTTPVGYVEGWHVDEDLRRKGVGRALIAAAEKWARLHNCSEMASDCGTTNHVSHQSHLALGFTPAIEYLNFRRWLSDPPTPARDFIAILANKISSETPVQLVTDPAAGGIAVFCGTTRAEKHADGRDLIALDYEAYSEMATQQMRDLAVRAREKWPIIKLAILHRIGRVNIAEPSVVIAVSTPHRGDAFEACKWLIDTLKSEVAIWKKEIWSDGSGSWVG
jgi:molybdopterin synthase catalytic subunit